jgi:hypothetical protein
MEKELALTTLSSLLSLVGFWYVVLWRYRTFRIDLFRQRMFEVRDDLFDFAAEGNIGFNHPAYGMLRSTMNGFARFGHRLTLWQMLFLGLFVRTSDIMGVDNFDKKWARAKNGLPDDTQVRLDQFREKMEMVVFRHMLVSVPECLLLPLILLATLPVILWKMAQSRASSLHKLLQLPVSNLDSAALLNGE